MAPLEVIFPWRGSIVIVNGETRWEGRVKLTGCDEYYYKGYVKSDEVDVQKDLKGWAKFKNRPYRDQGVGVGIGEQLEVDGFIIRGVKSKRR